METKFFCEVCHINCSGIEPFMQHMSSVKHKKKVEQKKLAGTVNFDGKDYYCPTCRISCSGIAPYQQHMISEKHFKKEHAKLLNERYASAMNDEVDPSSTTVDLKQNSEFLKKDGHGSEAPDIFTWKVENVALPAENAFQCSVCEKQFTGPVPFEQHINSSVHKKKLEKIKLESMWKTGASGSARIDVLSDNQTNNSVSSSENLASVETSFVCRLCEKSFPSVEMHKLHMLSSEHQMFEQQVSPHQDSPLYCNTCDKKFTGKIPFIQHMSSSVHSKNMKKAEMSINMSSEETSHMEMDHSPFKDMIRNTTVPALDGFYHVGGVSSNSPVAECYVCGVKFYDNEEVVKHYDSESHHEFQNIYNYKKKVTVFVPEQPFDLLA